MILDVTAYANWNYIATMQAGTGVIFAAVYLLFMLQNVVFGDLTDFLKRLGDRLTDVAPVEVATLAPLVILAVGFGLFPALILDLIQRRQSRLGIDVLDAFTFLEEDSLHPDIGSNFDHVVVHEVTVTHRLLVPVLEDLLREVSGRMRRGCGCEADLHRVEVIEGRAPDRDFGCDVAAVASVGDD